LFLSEPVVPGTGAYNILNGVSSITKNSDAFITNKGIELNIAYDVIRGNDMTLTLRANGSMNDNSIGGIKANGGRIINPNNTISENGGMINEPYVYKYLGVNPTNGNLLFENAAGQPTETPVGADRKAYGKIIYQFIKAVLVLIFHTEDFLPQQLSHLRKM